MKQTPMGNNKMPSGQTNYSTQDGCGHKGMNKVFASAQKDTGGNISRIGSARSTMGSRTITHTTTSGTS